MASAGVGNPSGVEQTLVSVGGAGVQENNGLRASLVSPSTATVHKSEIPFRDCLDGNHVFSEHKVSEIASIASSNKLCKTLFKSEISPKTLEIPHELRDKLGCSQATFSVCLAALGKDGPLDESEKGILGGVVLGEAAIYFPSQSPESGVAPEFLKGLGDPSLGDPSLGDLLREGKIANVLVDRIRKGFQSLKSLYSGRQRGQYVTRRFNEIRRDMLTSLNKFLESLINNHSSSEKTKVGIAFANTRAYVIFFIDVVSSLRSPLGEASVISSDSTEKNVEND